ncbi:MAG: diguanylate cyclase [Lysobacter sp.]|nr:diguanylate cyclase [Lysobacter sp.]
MRPPDRAHEHLAAAGLAWLLVLFTMGVLAATRPVAEPAPLVVQAEPGSHLGRDDEALLLAGGAQTTASAGLGFTLPAQDGTRWVLWLDRDPVDALWLEGAGWRSARRDFFHPAADEGTLPSGFVFPLPATWRGDISLVLHAQGHVRAALRPRLLREANAARLAYRGIALDSAVYAGLFLIALLALSLYSASRERAFLALAASSGTALLLAAASNGHLYATPLLDLFAIWRGGGLWALELLFCAATLQLLLRYADLREGGITATRWFDLASVLLVVLAAVCLLDLQGLAPWLQPAVTVASLAAAAGAVVVLVDATQRRVPMAWSLLLLGVLACVAGLARAALSHGLLPDSLWTRSGYQLALLVTAAVLMIGLISRIGEYRDQRDRDHLARIDSERRMAREAARAELTLALQTLLRTLPAADIEWTAFRLLLEHLLPHVPVQSAAVVAYGYHGHDLMLVEPARAKTALQEDVATRSLALRRLAQAGLPLQQPRTLHAQPVMEAVQPLAVRAPGWGVLLLQRAGSEGFSTEELALAGEFSRLAVLHADEALAAFQLRCSAELDALTGAFNRRSIDQWLARAFTDAHRRSQPLSLLFIDVDHFKAINDRIGHQGGDHCLRAIAATLRGALEEGDLLGRYGGEEFIVLLPGRGGAQAREIGERLRAAVQHGRVEYEGQTEQLTVSVGVASRLECEDTPTATVERADKALYAAKRGGRNCVQVAPAVFS